MLLGLGSLIFIVALLLLFAPRVLIKGNDLGNLAVLRESRQPVSSIGYFLFHYRIIVGLLLLGLAVLLLLFRWHGAPL